MLGLGSDAAGAGAAAVREAARSVKAANASSRITCGYWAPQPAPLLVHGLMPHAFDTWIGVLVLPATSTPEP